MIYLAAIALTLVIIFYGYGVVVTKNLIDTNCVHINYMQGLLIALAGAVLMPYGLSNPDYHWPST